MSNFLPADQGTKIVEGGVPQSASQKSTGHFVAPNRASGFRDFLAKCALKPTSTSHPIPSHLAHRRALHAASEHLTADRLPGLRARDRRDLHGALPLLGAAPGRGRHLRRGGGNIEGGLVVHLRGNRFIL